MMSMLPEVFMTLVLISSTSLVYFSSTNIYVISYLLYVIVEERDTEMNTRHCSSGPYRIKEKTHITSIYHIIENIIVTVCTQVKSFMDTVGDIGQVWRIDYTSVDFECK